MVTGRREDYLKAILALEKKGDVKAKDICGALGVGPSTVTEMLQKLDKEGFIEYEKYQSISLTENGKKIARETHKKHEMLKDLLLKIGVDEATAEEDACKMEHVLSDETLGKMTKAFNR